MSAASGRPFCPQSSCGYRFGTDWKAFLGKVEAGFSDGIQTIASALG